MDAVLVGRLFVRMGYDHPGRTTTTDVIGSHSRTGRRYPQPNARYSTSGISKGLSHETLLEAILVVKEM
jgi:hypothetical protein